jgi:hypothetical protein
LGGFSTFFVDPAGKTFLSISDAGIWLRGKRSPATSCSRRSTPALNIDNMEGVAAHRSASGETILTLISDDNYSPLQRTLLMQFTIPGGKPVLAEPTSR